MKKIPPLTTTTIGSVPYLDVNTAIELIAETCPVLPCWPQMTNLAPREDMILQSVDGLPALEIIETSRQVAVNTEDKDQALVDFYEHFMAEDPAWFKVPDEAAAGLGPFLERAATDGAFGSEFLKVQFTGPITFGQAVRTPEDKNLLDDPDLSDTIPKGLGMKGVWLAEKIRKIGKTPIIFYDEPSLTGFGSAFSNLKREQVIALINETAEIARSKGDVYIGCHVCGNTDWAMMAETTLDIINFDAYGFIDNFLLYPERIKAFLERGGYIAWGIVPTKDYTGEQTAKELADKLESGWKQLAAKKIDLDLIRERTIITPSCGTGSLDEDTATAVHRLLPQVADLLS